ncbi:HD domain-containing protein [Streptomyces sp. NPDC097619]|uniref:HD domain-containing protein n=1 Tax=Streptomyces sp. NPDC097619 TaxID=3157228 RepID=UPI0033250E16
MRIPTPDEIRALHEKYAPSPEALERVLGHCEIVWEVARGLLERYEGEIDRELVRAGCLLHDIGVYRLAGPEDGPGREHYIRHGILGHAALRAEGFPETLCRFASCHTGVGLSREDVLRQELPLPPADYLAVTPEERLVMYADKFHSKSRPPRFVAPDTYAVEVGRFGADKTVEFLRMREEFGEPGLAGLAGRYGHRLT